MPYLNFEIDERRAEMAAAIRKAAQSSIRQSADKGHGKPSIDETLICAYLRISNTKQTPPLHVRRTLDQYYYTFNSTEARDRDQVVYRYTDSTNCKQIFMVDQLWLFIIDEGEIRKRNIGIRLTLGRDHNYMLPPEVEARRG
jgi:hypothetical protein